jgi:hypothetical protein
MADALNLENLTADEIAELDALLEAEASDRRQARLSKDPEAWVVESFPWGTGQLSDEDGPDIWQRVVLRQIAEGLLDISEAIQIAIASGHGIGKSCLVAWIVLWSLTTKKDTRGNITANTGTQLSTKTWPEISKWFGLLDPKISGKFRLTSESIYNIDRPLTWRMDAIPWSIDRASAFAGLHNAGKRVVVIFDEASEIPDIIWETAEGAMTDADTELLWLVFGNPTINTGRFRECFGKFRHRWKGRQIDSRTVKRTNKARLAKLIADYGEDDDIVRIRILGVFPRSGLMQFIPSDVVDGAMKREDPAPTLQDPIVMGVDVARSLEGDETVIWVRRGRDARTFPRVRMRVRDTMLIAAKIVELAAFYHVDAIFVDGGGVGGGVVDRLNQLRQPVIEVQFGENPTGSIQSRDSGIVYYNRRAEMWGTMRDWLSGGYIPNEPELADEMTGPKYGYKQKDGRDAIILESKDSMKLRSLSSPDSADALCLTFALPVQPSRHQHAQPGRQKQEGPYDPFRDLRRQQ